MGKTSAAAKNRYRKKTYDAVQIMLPKGSKVLIQDEAAKSGDSMSAYISKAVLDRMGIDDWPRSPMDAGEASDPRQ